MIVEGDAGADHVEHHRSLVRDRRLQHRKQLLLVAGERAAHKRRAQLDRQRAGIDGRQIVDDAGLQLRADIRRRRELALRQSVNAVVFDDVDHRQIAAHQVNKLAHADRSRVAVAGDAERHAWCGWPACAPVVTEGMRPCTLLKLVRAAHEVGRALRRAADAAHLHHALGLHAHLIHGVDNALGDCVVAAAGAKRRLAAAILNNRKADVIHFGSRAPVGLGVAVAILQALLRRKLFGDGAGVDRQPVVVQNAAQLHHLVGRADRASAGWPVAHRDPVPPRTRARARPQSRESRARRDTPGCACSPRPCSCSFLIWSRLSRSAKSVVPNARKPIFEVPSFTTTGAGTSLRAFSNLRNSRSITAWYSSGFSV